MPTVLVEPDRLGAIQLGNLTVNPRADESFALDLFDHIPEFARLILDQWRSPNNFGTRLVSQKPIDNLLRRFPTRRLSSQRIVRLGSGGTGAAGVSVNCSGGRDCG